jgi:hypothetical protein
MSYEMQVYHWPATPVAHLYPLFESIAEKLGLPPPHAATPKLSGLTNAVTELLFVLQTVKGEM